MAEPFSPGGLKFKLSLLLLLALAGLGCRTGVPVSPGTWQDDPARALALRNRLDNLYPQSFRAVHRGILEAAGRTFVVEGYLLVRPDSFRLTVKADMGGTIFELDKAPGQETRVAKNSLGLRRAWLEQGAGRDVAVLYLRRPDPTARLVGYGADRWGLVQESSDGIWEEYLFDDAGRWQGYLRSRQERCLYRVDFSYGPPGSTGETPKIIHLTDHRLNYTLKINVLELSAVDSNPKGPRP